MPQKWNQDESGILSPSLENIHNKGSGQFIKKRLDHVNQRMILHGILVHSMNILITWS